MLRLKPTECGFSSLGNHARGIPVARDAPGARTSGTHHGRNANSSADSVATDTSVDRNTAEATVDGQAP